MGRIFLVKQQCLQNQHILTNTGVQYTGIEQINELGPKRFSSLLGWTEREMSGDTAEETIPLLTNSIGCWSCSTENGVQWS